jgi:hypothetical protein
MTRSVVDRIRQTESRVARNHDHFFNSIGHNRTFGDVGSMSGLPPIVLQNDFEHVGAKY